MIREVGQSRASAEALARLSEASTKTSFARMELRRLNREVRAARAKLKAARAAEAAADAAYYATPYGDLADVDDDGDLVIPPPDMSKPATFTISARDLGPVDE